MPELPEVETMRRGVLPIVGAEIKTAERTPCAKRAITIRPRIDHLSRKTVGRRIDAVDRIGKRVVLVLDDGGRIVFEPRMTGLVLIGNPPNLEHLRFRLRLKMGRKSGQLLFWDRRGLGVVQWFSSAEFEKHFDGTIGPDALQIEWSELKSRLAASRRAIKVALLDQKVVAGIGNLYASEILHLAKIHPETGCDQLRDKQWQIIQQSTVEILNAAIQHEGSTLSDGTYRNALNESGSYQQCHAVYDRANESCHTCRKSKIVRIVQAQRSTFFCERCQRKSRRK